MGKILFPERTSQYSVSCRIRLKHGTTERGLKSLTKFKLGSFVLKYLLVTNGIIYNTHRSHTLNDTSDTLLTARQGKNWSAKKI